MCGRATDAYKGRIEILYTYTDTVADSIADAATQAGQVLWLRPRNRYIRAIIRKLLPTKLGWFIYGHFWRYPAASATTPRDRSVPREPSPRIITETLPIQTAIHQKSTNPRKTLPQSVTKNIFHPRHIPDRVYTPPCIYVTRHMPNDVLQIAITYC